MSVWPHPSIAPYEAFPSADGDEIVIAIQNEREWARFCSDVLEDAAMASDPDFDTNENRVANRDRLRQRICSVFGALSTGDAIARLADAKIAYGTINSVAGLSSHPQLNRVSVTTPGGAVEMPAPAVRFDGTAVKPGPVPAVGQHSDALRAEFSTGETELAETSDSDLG